RTTGGNRTRNFPILNRAPLPLGHGGWSDGDRADEWIRTTTERVLNALPLPVGLRRLVGVAGGIRTRTGWPLRPLPLPVGLPRRVPRGLRRLEQSYACRAGKRSERSRAGNRTRNIVIGE